MEMDIEIIQRIDEKLKKGKRREIIDFFIGGLIILSVVLFAWIDPDIDSNLSIAIIVVLLIAMLVWQNGTEVLHQKERDRISGELGGYLINEKFPDMQYNLKSDLPKKMVKTDMGFQIEYKKIRIRDQIRGEYKGNLFDLSMVSYITKGYQQPGRRTLFSPELVVFRGPWIIMKAAKSFYGEINIASRIPQTETLQTYMEPTGNGQFDKVLGAAVQDERDLRIFENQNLLVWLNQLHLHAGGRIFLKILQDGTIYFYAHSDRDLFRFQEYGASADELKCGYEYELREIQKILEDLIKIQKEI